MSTAALAPNADPDPVVTRDGGAPPPVAAPVRPMRLAVMMLCHEPPEQLARRLRMPFFRNEDLKVYLHYDARRPAAELDLLGALLPRDLQIEFVRQRVACHWGEYSLVEATRRLMDTVLADTSFEADYLLLCSGSCVPIRPLASLREYLRRRRGIDFIQAHDISKGPWVKDGLEAERYRHYFPLNFLRHRKAFDLLTSLQRRLRVERRMPPGLRIHFGSQWFCLTRATATGVAERLRDPVLTGFFRKSWIPDEFAIQTLVASVQEAPYIAGFSLTYYEFDRAGRPLLLDNGHEEHLLGQPFFFARKLAPEATALHEQLDAMSSGSEPDLAYFDRIGTPTVHYQRHLTDVSLGLATHSALGTSTDPWRGPLDSNRRRYYVWTSSSCRFLGALLRAARGSSDLPIFDFPFDPRQAIIARERSRFLGLQAGDIFRRDHDPSAYLLELVRLDTPWPIGFGLDLAQPVWVRDFVRWDPNAIIVDCDPPGLDVTRRAAAAMLDAEAQRDADLFERTKRAALAGEPLPRDLASAVGKKEQRRCKTLQLSGIDYDNEIAPVRAVFEAARRISAEPFFPGPDAAAAMVWRST